jgi:hypothetical protein
MVKRRYPVDQAMICVPNSEELEKIKHYESQTKGGQDIIHTEPLNKCEFPVALKNVSREDYLDKLKEIKVSRKVGGKFTFFYNRPYLIFKKIFGVFMIIRFYHHRKLVLQICYWPWQRIYR